jgi:hypothetical protein
MGSGSLSLPVDIPWKRMGFTGSMMDRDVGELQFPALWRSSIAIYYHDAQDLPPDYANRRVTYFKVVCTITNFAVQEDSLFSTLSDLAERYRFYWTSAFLSNVTQSYPCYGALLQFSVHPHPITHPDIRLENYPYISAFQPRKREMYEAVTESGEIASQSSNQVNVGKQSTSTDSTEEFDLDMGYSKHRGGSGGASVLWGLVDVKGSGEKTDTVNRQVGDVNRNTLQDQHIQSTDTGREKRESYSHSSTINHIYSLLQGYHLGTNRAVFFMQPRPHIQNARFTFIRGLRALEGVQEFFLIVNRPAEVERLCVEVALETAHMRVSRAYKPRLIPLNELYSGNNLERTAAALGLDLDDYQSWTDLLQWNGYYPHARTAFHEYARTGTSEILVSWINSGMLEWEDVHLMMNVIEKVPEIGIEDIALIFEEYERNEGEFFVAGRRLGSCMAQIPDPPDSGPRETLRVEVSAPENASTFDDPRGASIVYEGFLAPHAAAGIGTGRDGSGGRADDANLVLSDLNRALFNSIGSPMRYAYGEVGPVESEVVLDEMARFVRVLQQSGVKDPAIAEVPALYRHQEALARLNDCITATGLGKTTTAEIARCFDVKPVEAKRLRHELLTAVLEALDPDSLDPSAPRVNPVRERLEARYPHGRLNELERSAGLVVRADPPGPGQRVGPSKIRSD